MDLSIFKKLLINGVELHKLFIGTKFTNKVPLSIDTDKSIYQGCGYIEGYRLSSSGPLSAQTGTITTGFIPCKSTDLIRMYGVDWFPSSGNGYLSFYDSSFTLLGSVNCYPDADYSTGYLSAARGNVKFKGTDLTPTQNHPAVENGVFIFNQYEFKSDADKVAYFRINGNGNPYDMIVTVNEDILIRQIWKKPYKNWVRYSTESDGKTIYNGGLGYKNGYRIRSGGGEGELSTSAHTGFIPVKAGDVVRIGGLDFGSEYAHGSAMNVSNSSFTNIGQFSMTAGEYGIFTQSAYKAYSQASVVQEKTGVWKWVVPPASSGVAYIRVSANTSNASSSTPPPADGSKMIVTINEEIIL